MFFGSSRQIRKKHRSDIGSIVRANASRVQEAIRTIEEFSKIECPGISDKLKKIRFDVYDIEKSLFNKVRKSQLLAKKRMACVVVIDDTNSGNHTLADITKAVIDTGIEMIIFRDTISTDAEFIRKASEIIDICNKHEVTVLLHGRLDVSLMLDADGITMGIDDIPASMGRKFAGQDFIIGLTTASEKECSDYVDNSIDFVYAQFITNANTDTV